MTSERDEHIKKIIIDVLDSFRESHVNLASYAARDVIKDRMFQKIKESGVLNA